jgi:hypothetical protein
VEEGAGQWQEAIADRTKGGVSESLLDEENLFGNKWSGDRELSEGNRADLLAAGMFLFLKLLKLYFSMLNYRK